MRAPGQHLPGQHQVHKKGVFKGVFGFSPHRTLSVYLIPDFTQNVVPKVHEELSHLKEELATFYEVGRVPQATHRADACCIRIL